MRSTGLVFITILLSCIASRSGRSDVSNPTAVLSRHPQWLRLGHYKKRWSGGYRSLVIAPTFFLSADGRDNPESELRATIEAFNHPENPSSSAAICAFPARHAWLLKQGVALPTPTTHCSERDEWVKGIDAQSVTLVFSSSYPNNPASMFGHTLLKFNKSSTDSILNYGANFEARVSSKDAVLLYAMRGLLGLYPGEFTISPYYMKINEYNYSESRDLWEYDLNLSQNEVGTLVNHLWELYTSGGFDYYFLNQNCSFQLLALIEVAKPEWNLTDDYLLYTLPVDTVKQIARIPGAVVQERRRSSLHHKLTEQVDRLTTQQASAREHILDGQAHAEQSADPAVLESVLTTLDYRRRKNSTGLAAKDEQLLYASLLRRAQLGSTPQSLSESSSEAQTHFSDSPIISHDSRMVFGGFLTRGGSSR